MYIVQDNFADGTPGLIGWDNLAQFASLSEADEYARRDNLKYRQRRILKVVSNYGAATDDRNYSYEDDIPIYED